jgi:hypothetical protein
MIFLSAGKRNAPPAVLTCIAALTVLFASGDNFDKRR